MRKISISGNPLVVYVVEFPHRPEFLAQNETPSAVDLPPSPACSVGVVFEKYRLYGYCILINTNPLCLAFFGGYRAYARADESMDGSPH